MTVRTFLRVLFFGLLIPATATAADDVLTLGGYLDMERVQGPQISPDGSQIIYTRRWVNKKEDRLDSALWLMDADGGKNRQLLRGGGARWSPDGTRILYSTKGDDGDAQIFVRWMDAEGNVTQISRGDKSPALMSWSPDGKSIAYRATVPFKSDWTIELPARPKGANWTEDATIIDDLHFRLDRRGLIKGYDHLFIVPSDGGTARQLTSGDWHVGSRYSGIDFGSQFDWTPDGKEIIFDGIHDDHGDMRYMESQIHAVDVATGDIRQLTNEEGFWSNPKVSPDGGKVAFTGYGAGVMRDSHAHPELYIMNIDGSGMTQLTDATLGAPSQLHWTANGSGLYFTIAAEGSRNVHHITLKGKSRTVTEGAQMVGLSSMSDGQIAVGTRSAADAPGDVVKIDLRKGDITRLTHVNDEVLRGKKLASLEEVWYNAPDGTRVQGWIQFPPDFDASEKYPLILQIHGGPHGMYNVGFNYMRQIQAADGYVVLYTNPRGSTGYGVEFANAIDNAYPGPFDFQDLMAGVDAVIERGYIDEDRLYVFGCSGGGALTAWLVSHTDRFAAAAALCPVINWISFAGTADVVGWGYGRFSEPYWENPAKWLEHSPIMHVGKVKTPTLLMTGDLDMRTPIAQAEEFYTALKMRGIPTKLVIVHGEYHGTTSKPSNFMRTELILKKWFEEFGGPESDEVAAASAQ